MLHKSRKEEKSPCRVSAGAHSMMGNHHIISRTSECPSPALQLVPQASCTEVPLVGPALSDRKRLS